MRKKHKDQAHRLRVLTGKEKENEPNGFCSLLMSRCPEATGDDTEYCKNKVQARQACCGIQETWGRA